MIAATSGGHLLHVRGPARLRIDGEGFPGQHIPPRGRLRCSRAGRYMGCCAAGPIRTSPATYGVLIALPPAIRVWPLSSSAVSLTFVMSPSALFGSLACLSLPAFPALSFYSRCPSGHSDTADHVQKATSAFVLPCHFASIDLRSCCRALPHARCCVHTTTINDLDMRSSSVSYCIISRL